MLRLSEKIAPAFERIGGVYALPVILMVVALPLIGSISSWATLTIAGLAMGMMIFLMTSGLSLVFGLMNVLNFAHGQMYVFGGFVTYTVVVQLGLPFIVGLFASAATPKK